MLKNNFIIILITLVFFQISTVSSKEKFFSLKKNKVNVRYGPSFDFPVKYIYKKMNLPIKQIDKKENFRRIIDYKKNSGWIHIFINISYKQWILKKGDKHDRSNRKRRSRS